MNNTAPTNKIVLRSTDTDGEVFDLEVVAGGIEVADWTARAAVEGPDAVLDCTVLVNGEVYATYKKEV